MTYGPGGRWWSWDGDIALTGGKSGGIVRDCSTVERSGELSSWRSKKREVFHSGTLGKTNNWRRKKYGERNGSY